MSAPDREIVFSPEARAELRDILAFTRRRWGVEQRRAYERLLADAFAKLSLFPDLGSARPEYGEHVRGFRVAQHVILYRTMDTEVRIAGIRHVRQAFPEG